LRLIEVWTHLQENFPHTIFLATFWKPTGWAHLFLALETVRLIFWRDPLPKLFRLQLFLVSLSPEVRPFLSFTRGGTVPSCFVLCVSLYLHRGSTPKQQLPRSFPPCHTAISCPTCPVFHGPRTNVKFLPIRSPFSYTLNLKMRPPSHVPATNPDTFPQGSMRRTSIPIPQENRLRSFIFFRVPPLPHSRFACVTLHLCPSPAVCKWLCLPSPNFAYFFYTAPLSA